MIQVLPDDNAYLRKLFDAMSSPHAETLLHVLGGLPWTGAAEITEQRIEQAFAQVIGH